MTVSIDPLDGAPFGARVVDLRPRTVDADTRRQLRDACADHHGVLVIDFGRLLEVDELNALTAIFGESEFAPGMITGIGKRRADDEPERSVDDQVAALRQRGIDPYLMFLGNVDPRTGERRSTDELFFGEWEWHTDMSYISVPPTFSLLHARMVPPDGGDTSYASQVLAAATLPDALRGQIQGRRIKHDSTYTSAGMVRPGMTEPASPVEAIGTYHPILRRLPETGQEALFLGRRTNAYVEDLPLAESEALLDDLWAHATQEAFTYRHTWSPGEVVVWDNRVVMHCRHPFDPDHRRFMWRTQTKGEAVLQS